MSHKHRYESLIMTHYVTYISAPKGPEYVFCHELASTTISILTNMAYDDKLYKNQIITSHGLLDLLSQNLSAKDKKLESIFIPICNLLKGGFIFRIWALSIFTELCKMTISPPTHNPRT